MHNPTDSDIVSKVGLRRIYSAIRPFIIPYRTQFILVVVVVVVAAILGRLIPFIIGRFVDQVITPKSYQYFLVFIGCILLLEVLSLIFEFFQVYYFQKLGNRVLTDIRVSALDSITKLKMSFFNNQPIGRIVTKATNDIAQVGEVFSDGVVKVCIQFVVLISIVTSMSFISVKLMLISLGLTPLFWLVIITTQKIRDALRESKAAASAMNSFTSENLSGIKTVHQFNLSTQQKKQYETHSSRVSVLAMKSTKFYALMMPILNTFNATILSLTLFFGANEVQNGAMSVGSLIAFLLYALEFVHPFRDIIEKYQQFQNGLTSAERVVDLLQSPQERHSDHSTQMGSISKIEFKDVTFKYSLDGKDILSGVSFSIKSGESLGLIGRTGSGKTTIASLLLGLFEAPPESIFLNDRPIEQYSLIDLRNRVLCLQQDVFVFRGTILENMTLNNSRISEDRVRQISNELGIIEYFQKTGRTLDSQVEELGKNLSVGEKQLISFARILLLDPDVVILDEATASINSELEMILQTAFNKALRGRISIVIAHRLKTILACDKILVLDQGQVLESGYSKELLDKKSHFKDLLANYLGTTS